MQLVTSNIFESLHVCSHPMASLQALYPRTIMEPAQAYEH